MSIRKQNRRYSLSLAVSRGLLRRLHGDERGSISIVSVFTVMFLAMLLGMVMNVGRHVDGKIRMQNAADSAAYSGGVVLARGMNTLAFTNHLLCDVFAVTAFLREARDQNSASYAPRILAAWNKVAQVFSSSGFPKFTALGSAIQQKVPLEQQLVDSYSAWAKSVSDLVLPMMEEILAEELIPKYQRAVVVAFPEIAQAAARETAARNGDPDHHRGPMFGVLWRTDARPVGGDADSGYSPDDRTLPVIDPELDSVANQEQYVRTAVQQRQMLSKLYLDQWNAELLGALDQLGKMSQFSGLWRSFTCGYLEKLLTEEYPRSNLLFVIHENPLQTANSNTTLQKHYTYIGVVYWKKLPEMAPGLFKNPLDADAQAFAEVHLFIPRNRLGWVSEGGSGTGPSQSPLGGVPGEIAFVPIGNNGGGGGGGNTRWVVGRVGGPTVWNLLNQSWNCQLAPATQPALVTILQSDPGLPGFSNGSYKLPTLGGLSSEEIQQISPH
ncbi:MAG: pilus assembly protein TadG-related protein [Planctomycetota bacterium]